LKVFDNGKRKGSTQTETNRKKKKSETGLESCGKEGSLGTPEPWGKKKRGGIETQTTDWEKRVQKQAGGRSGMKGLLKKRRLRFQESKKNLVGSRGAERAERSYKSHGRNTQLRERVGTKVRNLVVYRDRRQEKRTAGANPSSRGQVVGDTTMKWKKLY